MEDETPGGIAGRTAQLEGRVIDGRYQIENVVSAGANTIVTEAVDTRDNRPVTLKVVQPERAWDADFAAAFDRQIRVARTLSHPNIAPILDNGTIDLGGESTPYWVVEYLGGGSLRDIFDRGRLLEPSQALVVGLEACRALEAAHARGVVHTELTPSKLVFGVDGRLRIIDFAMAQLLGAEAWAEPATVPTHVARYASPEQALSQTVDATTDVYALSLCLIEGITGSVPFAGDSTVSTLAGRVGKLMPVTADMGSLAAVLERGGRPDPEDRWTASEFGKALVQAAETLPRPEPVPVVATSLFAAGLAARHAARATPPVEVPPADVAPDVPVPEVPVPGVPAPGVPAPDVPATASTDVAGDETQPMTPVAPPTTAAADAPLILLTDAAASAGAAQTETAQTASATGAAQTETAQTASATGAAQAETAQTAGDDTSVATPNRTVEMPASLAAAAAVATTPDTTDVRAVVDPTPYDAERESRPWGKYVALSLVALVGVVALGIAAFLLLRTKSYEVPDLVGVDEAIARNEVGGNGWEVVTERERSDEVRDIDHVVRTEPVAGEQLAEGETFVMIISDGPLLRTLPDFAGTPIDEVRTTLEEMELGIAERDPEYSETVPVDTVVSWSVQGDGSLGVGAQVLPGTVVEVTVSLGPAPRPAPDLTNMTPEEATAALEDIQLVYAAAEDVFSSTIESGRVAAQDPAVGTEVERGGTVTVQISKGPELVAIPDLAGTTYPEAVKSLEAAGFVVNSLLGTTQGTFVSISVNGQETAAGETFPRGTGVDLVFL